MQVYQWIEAQQVVISAALVYHRHANASEILCMTNLGRYGGRIDLEIKLRAFRIPIQRVGNARVLHISPRDKKNAHGKYLSLLFLIHRSVTQ
jgi:hypothetical protein